MSLWEAQIRAIVAVDLLMLGAVLRVQGVFQTTEGFAFGLLLLVIQGAVVGPLAADVLTWWLAALRNRYYPADPINEEI